MPHRLTGRTFRTFLLVAFVSICGTAIGGSFWFNSFNNGLLSADVPEPRKRVETDDMTDQELLRKLALLEVRGFSLGSPYRFVLQNETTAAIITIGPRIGPKLTAFMKTATYDGAVHAVYCLRNMQYKQARPEILELLKELESGSRFVTVHDGTLFMEIRGYLEQWEAWP